MTEHTIESIIDLQKALAEERKRCERLRAMLVDVMRRAHILENLCKEVLNEDVFRSTSKPRAPHPSKGGRVSG